uniref:DNA-directed RNA polymerase subunit beta'' n=1 Tax=Cliftonaea pectinata TaxID=2007206 RepID=A0A1Z1MPH3_9FLOR|nr:RNA polymerase b''''-subunit [Cliftonaea pectinata]ARW67983.1 RNA polymerase b''''-subunit [Cliftonaea pectinata]
MNKYVPEIYFYNKIINKSELKNLITWAFRNYGIARASNMADKLKDLGFYYATKAGISLSLEDLRIPPTKHDLLNETLSSIKDTDTLYQRGEITIIERFQKVIDTWNHASDSLKNDVIQYFEKTDPLNSIYMMAFSGARANISQVRQLVGMRGLMADPQGQIIDLPIFHNFREGLTVTDYFISSYGARKGLVDTALRTADSGYLTRRLVDVSQDIIIREYDCKTLRGILLEEMIDNKKTIISLSQSLLGRVLAEDVINTNQNKVLGKSGDSIDNSLAQKIMKLGIQKILVRSPLTCLSSRSVCQLCYGWNLAHGKMVDLGEAVGIIAAQSIGEPGTQLTMRTFHTGGVFTGELSQNIVTNHSGTLIYPSNTVITKTRNKHGNNVLLVHSDCILKLVDIYCKVYDFSLLKGSLVLINNNTFIKKGTVIAEYPLNSKLTKEKAQKTIVANFPGSIYFDNKIIDNNDLIKGLNKSIIVWVLAGEVYNLPKNVSLVVSSNQFIKKDSLIARTELLSRYNGKIYLVKDKVFTSKLLLVTSCKIFTNLKVFTDTHHEHKKYILETNSKDKFLLRHQINKKINNRQIIADLVSDLYKTKTGGIIKYLDLSLSKNVESNSYDLLGSGYILWIPEETHIINKDASLLLSVNGSFIQAGTEIIQNIFANNSGILEVIQKDGIIREVIIKPGRLYELSNNFQHLSKYRGFLRPGQIIFNEVISDKLVYWEYMAINNQSFILLRPVIIYSVPKKDLFFKFSENSFSTDTVNIKQIRKTYFKDGERVKSVIGLNLVSTHLIIELHKEALSLKCYIQFQNIKSSMFIKIITADFLSLKDKDFSFIEDNYLYSKTLVLVNEGQYIQSGFVVSRTNIFSAIEGKIDSIEINKSTNRRILITTSLNTFNFNIPEKQDIKVKLGDLLYAGDYVTKNIVSNYSGKVISIKDNQVIIRIGQPYLLSSGSFLHVDNSSLIRAGENIATIIFEKLKTGDIVQGLPRIEEILEARKKLETSFNPHVILDAKFNFYLGQGLSISNSTKLSFTELQLLLVKEIQAVYQSQGVYIADKHIEVIVKQMTSKVRIENGGDTEYLPGEIVDLQRILNINKSLQLINKLQASYYPILLGITKASLNTDSFISAASFQETTKVLTEAAISGKLDWLRGLKENVIIGRLIPAGTGFNAYNTKKNIQSTYSKSELINNSNQVPSLYKNSQNHFEDIIVDDRIIKNYPLQED